jgi:hypothetical protein
MACGASEPPPTELWSQLCVLIEVDWVSFESVRLEFTTVDTQGLGFCPGSRIRLSYCPCYVARLVR